ISSPSASLARSAILIGESPSRGGRPTLRLPPGSMALPRARRPSRAPRPKRSEGERAMSGRLQDRIALVTGAGSVGPGWGNGRAPCVRFAEEGAKIFAVDRDLASTAETVERVKAAGGDIHVH